MNPIVTSKEAKLVVGIGVQTNNMKEVSGDAIPGKIPNSLSSNEILGVYTQYENGVSGNYLMLIGRKSLRLIQYQIV